MKFLSQLLWSAAERMRARVFDDVRHCHFVQRPSSTRSWSIFNIVIRIELFVPFSNCWKSDLQQQLLTDFLFLLSARVKVTIADRFIGERCECTVSVGWKIGETDEEGVGMI